MCIQQVTTLVETDEDPIKITEIIDKRLGSNYDQKSVIHVVKLALRCVSAELSSRPSISEVVIEIKLAIKYHNDSALSFQICEDTLTEYGDLQNTQVCVSDYSGPVETGYSGNSTICRSKEDDSSKLVEY